jgi:Lon protease-like protein
VLRGLDRFRIVEEDAGRSYRRAVVDPLREPGLAHEDRAHLRTCRAKLEVMLTSATERGGTGAARSGEPRMPTAMSDEDLVNALAQYLDLEPLEKQALLERPDLRSRATSLVELLEMKVMAARTPSVSHVAH